MTVDCNEGDPLSRFVGQETNEFWDKKATESDEEENRVLKLEYPTVADTCA